MYAGVTNNEAYFIKRMNLVAKKLGLKNTKYSNVHGVYHDNNWSTTFDQCLLVQKSMKWKLFKQLIKTYDYDCIVTKDCGEQVSLKFVQTNKLVKKDGYIGVKTGVTEAAGPC